MNIEKVFYIIGVFVLILKYGYFEVIGVRSFYITWILFFVLIPKYDCFKVIGEGVYKGYLKFNCLLDTFWKNTKWSGNTFEETLMY